MSVYELITEKILAMLKQGVVPWRKPWRGDAFAPQNLLSRRGYRGINAVLLACMPYRAPYWVTYKQALQLGGHVRRGERSCPIVFWRWIERQEKEGGDAESFPVLRYYHVFNVEQCELPGGAVPQPAAIVQAPFQPIAACEEVVRDMPQPPALVHDGGDSAYYHVLEDTVHMPQPEQFAARESYYATLFHELAHATGHQRRLARQELISGIHRDANAYSKEELVAEVGAAFLCGHCGIAARTIDNQAAYIQGWLQALRNDQRMVVQAAAAAQKAADYILRRAGERGGARGGAERVEA